MRKLGTAPVPQDELATRQAVLVGNFGRTIETTDGIADILANYTLQGVPLEELSRYIPRVQAVDPAAVESVSATLLDPKAASIIVVGDAKQFLPALRQAHPEVEVIPAASVNLDSPKLR
ncbi:hypothetical protein GCM10020258_24980 [Sphingomonas yabuuchiae]